MQLGAHTVTMPTKTFRQLMSHPLTDKGLAGFMKDWAESKQPVMLKRTLDNEHLPTSYREAISVSAHDDQ